jgi:hypothetical protein
MYNFNKLFGPANAPSRPLPQQMLAPEFGEVSVRQVDNRLQVAAALAMGAFLMGDGERFPRTWPKSTSRKACSRQASATECSVAC